MPAPVLGLISVNDVYVLSSFPRLASLIAHHRRHTRADRWLVVLAGDFLAPSLLSSLDGGRRMVQALNALGVTHVIFGNHEDDLEPSQLKARVHEFHGVWLGTNVRGFEPPLAPSDVVDVTGVKVGLVGAVMTDPAVYRRPPFGGVTLDDPNTSLEQEATRLRQAGCHTVIALTHQWLADDRRLAEAGIVSLILGGHEHDPHLERHGGTVLSKSGMDATRAAVVTLTLSSPPEIEVHLEPVSPFPEDPTLAARVAEADAFIERLSGAVLVPKLDAPLSAAGGRAAQTSMGSFVCSHLRDALGAEVALFNGGGIRGTEEHTSTFTLGDLKNELPFDNEVVVTTLPGAVVRDAVAYSRRNVPRGDGGFLQVDDGVRVADDGKTPTHLAGAPLEPQRLYRVALPRPHLVGLDRIEPLEQYSRAHPEVVPPVGTGREPRLILLEVLARERLSRLGGFEALDLDHDGRVDRRELSAALTREGLAPSEATVSLVLDTLDQDHDRQLTRSEVTGRAEEHE
ncbi:MAG: 5'-nucleotidase C-terminal domain-containing protein [Myxococcaceae bacterium]|jgi:2',3'-cyclic-nucleotide 2'-phosphodiesterase (5'-nucleotidase family)|nr:5'-nucleotidase C-terminal domain-containing protein [Myxococcaceae bacterium]